MDIIKFLRLLYKRWWLLIGVPLITVVVAYFLVRYQPDRYRSVGRLATGIADQSRSQQVLNLVQGQESGASQEFGNLIQMMMLNKVLDQVSYQLMIHDLTAPQPFLPPGKLLQTLSPAARSHALEVYRRHYQEKTELSRKDKDEDGIYRVMESMGYDHQSLREKLNVYRVSNSDYIDVECITKSPDLSAFIINTLCTEFIAHYTAIEKENRVKEVTYLGKLLAEKQAAMDQQIADLKDYKIRNRVLNLNEQAKSLYGQLADFETKRGIAEKDIASYTAALRDIDSRFDPTDRRYIESTVTKVNGDIVDAKQQLYALNDQYISSGFDDSYRARIDAQRNRITGLINQSSDKYIVSPLAAKQELVNQKLAMEVTLGLAKNSITSIDKELNRLNRKFDGLVPHEAVIGAYENQIDIASREYLELLGKYNQASLSTNFAVELRQIQEAMPGSILPSRKMMLIVLAGVVSFIFCVVVLFALFYFDRSVTEPKEVVARTNMPLLGTLSTVKGDNVNLQEVWRPGTAAKEVLRLRDELRAIRFETDQEMGGGNANTTTHHKVLAITSLKEGEGKTFLAINLAYAYAMANKKVLLIDGNFGNPSITAILKPAYSLEDYLGGRPLPDAAPNSVQVLGNKGGGSSLMEIAGSETIAARLLELRNQYDIILAETAPLAEQDKAKEWLQLSDKVVAVFEKGKTLTEPEKPNLAYLQRIGNVFAGWVFNQASASGKRK
ncbi:MAG: hypothetical protein ABW019_01865 [Chitinophagaceae bacterium]